MKPESPTLFDSALEVVEAAIAAPNHRDGLLEPLPEGTSKVLQDVVFDLEDHLFARYPKADALRLLQEREPRRGFRSITPVSDDVELALRLLNNIRSATRCNDDDPEHPDRRTKLIFGKVGVRDKKRQAGTRKERRPEITSWIVAQLQRDPHAKSPDLWQRAPQSITDQIGERRFATRVTACRKKLASN